MGREHGWYDTGRAPPNRAVFRSGGRWRRLRGWACGEDPETRSRCRAPVRCGARVPTGRRGGADVGGREVVVTHPERVLFPDDGVTKGELVEYYLAVAAAMLPLVAGRPVTLQRFPDGLGRPGFYQKQVAAHAPDWIERVTVAKAGGGTVTHMVCGHAEDLAWIANQSCVTPHVWLSRAGALDRPDLLVFDLDPAGEDWPAVLAAARLLRALLDELALPAYVKTTGSRGLHVAVPLEPEATAAEAEALAYDVARALTARDPDRLTTEWLVEDRGGRLLLDVARNRWAQMIAAPYAVRALPGAPVSVPLAWEELDEPGFRPGRLTLRSVPARLASTPDPWAGMQARGARVAEARERLAAAVPGLALTPPGRTPSRFGRNDRRLRRR
jgi:bifunctional non-homologous end joining protein LigD